MNSNLFRNASIFAEAYVYKDGRRTLTQTEGETATRTLYDGMSFDILRQGTADSNGRFVSTDVAKGNFNPYGGYFGNYGYSSNFWLDLFVGGMWGFGNGAHGSNQGKEEIPEYFDIDNIYPLYANGSAVATYEEDLVYSPSVTYWTGWGGFFGGYCTTQSSNYATYTETNYFAADILDTVKVATGNNGSVIGYADYDVFGTPYQRGGTLREGNLMYGYTGKPVNTVTGLSDYGYRDYSSKLGRFTTVDPIRDGNNWYTYVNNNPVNFRDLRGLENVYFLYTFDESDSFMKLQERWTIENDKRYLEKNGLSVKIVESATKQDILDALYDSDAMLIITSGHGDARGGIYTADNSKLKLTDIDSTQIGSNLKTVIFENCHQGTYEKEWETVLGGNVDVVGWTGITRTYETIGFNTLGWFDRQDKRLKDYEHDIVEYAQSSKNKCQNTTH